MAKTIGAPSNSKQQKGIFRNSEVKAGVRSDDTVTAESRGDCFAHSARERVLDKHTGFGTIKPTSNMNDVQKDGGKGTFSSDDRKAQLPEQGVRLNIHGRRRDEHVIGRSSTDVNDDSTVHGEDLA